MGYGVYSHDYKGAGSTFGVSVDHQSYDDYCEAQKAEGISRDDPDFLSSDTFYQDQSDDDVATIESVLKRTAEAFNLQVVDSRQYRAEPWQDNLCIYAVGHGLTLGWRSWQHDYVIGAHANEKFGNDFEAYQNEITRDTYRAASSIKEAFDKQVELMLEYVRLSLSEEGMECRYKTGGYTSAAYETLDEAELTERLQAIAAQVPALQAVREATDEAAFANSTDAQRQEIYAAWHDEDVMREYNPLRLAAYDNVDDRLVWIALDERDEPSVADHEPWPDTLLRPAGAGGDTLTLMPDSHDLVALCAERTIDAHYAIAYKAPLFAPALSYLAAAKVDIDLDVLPAPGELDADNDHGAAP